MRTRLIEQVTQMLRRPGLYVINDQDFESMCKLRLDDLRFLDGLPEPTRDDLGLSDKYRSCGIPGLFREAFGTDTRFHSEVASLFAEIFHGYGYLTVDRLLPDEPWSALLAAADSAFNGRDAHLSEIVKAFGPPSFRIHKYVYCYAPESGTGWAFFDGFGYTPDDHGAPATTFRGYPSDPVLRSIRLPGPDFEESLRLTRQGEALRHHTQLERLN
ncbi:hypothetical protein GCM10009783_48160 [Glycomyces lechevalierae]